jgi:hypothetical protein
MNSGFLFKTGEFVLRSKRYPFLNACLHFGAEGTQLYAYGYKRAAEVLVEYALHKRMELDTLVYPILFLYRQCIELQLKSLIRNGSILLETPRQAPTTHDLGRLWIQCKKILENIFEEDQSSINKIETIVLQLSEADPYSQAFRYPKDKKGNELLAGITHINLRAISDVLGEVVSLLDGAETGISEYLTNKCL